MLKLRHDFMKSSMIMIVTAVLLAAACAGIVLSDEAYAEEDGAEVQTEPQYTVTYIVDGASKSVPAEGNYALEAPEDIGLMVPEGKKFLGWQLSNEGTPEGNTFSEGSIYNVTANVTFIANLSDITYTVSFDTGIDGETPVKISGTADDTIGSKMDSVVKNPEKEGYIFMGWAIADETPITDFGEIKFTADVTYKAVFVVNYDVVFMLNGAVVVSSDVNELSIAEDLANIITIVPTQENYTFEGWADASGKVAITYMSESGDYVLNKDYEFSANTILTAKFTPNNMTITLKADGVEDQTLTVLYGETAVKPALPEGYAYWAVQTKAPVYGEDGATIVEPAEYKEFDFSTAITSDMVLYAIAGDAPAPDESIYATFNIEGTIYGPYKVSDRFSIPQTDREGYDFLGWTVQGGDGTLLTSAQVQGYQYTEDVTFIANYVAVEPPAPEEPAFYETTTGQAAIVLIVFVIVLFVAAVYMNIGGLREKLFGWKITRKD